MVPASVRKGDAPKTPRTGCDNPGGIHTLSPLWGGGTRGQGAASTPHRRRCESAQASPRAARLVI